MSEVERPQSHIAAGSIKSTKISNDPIWNRTRARDTFRLKSYIVWYLQEKVKGKIVSVHATKAYRGIRSIAALS
jgi:hypothetical protein